MVGCHPSSSSSKMPCTSTLKTIPHCTTALPIGSSSLRNLLSNNSRGLQSSSSSKLSRQKKMSHSCQPWPRASVLRSGSVRFFAPKTRNRGPQPVQDRPRYCGDRTGPPRTGLLQSTQPKKTGSDRFFGVNFVVPIKIISTSTIITLKIKRVI
jgi:hypothetical protein